MKPVLCGCGCGLPTTLATYNRRECGWVKGQPKRFLHGHHGRLKRRSYVVDPVTGCWNWSGHINKDGYPSRITVDGQRIAVHQYFYEQKNGPIPVGTEIDHGCRNRRCVNPDHLEPVTHTENQRRRPYTKLTFAQAQEIRALAGTTTHRELAVRFQIAQSTISEIISGKRWRAA